MHTWSLVCIDSIRPSFGSFPVPIHFLFSLSSVVFLCASGAVFVTDLLCWARFTCLSDLDSICKADWVDSWHLLLGYVLEMCISPQNDILGSTVFGRWGCTDDITSKKKNTVVFGSHHLSFSPTGIAEQNTESCVRGQGHHESAFTVGDENWLYSHAKWRVC